MACYLTDDRLHLSHASLPHGFGGLGNVVARLTI